MKQRRMLFGLWLIGGVALFAHDVLTGGGLAGLLLLRELNAYGVVAPALTYIAEAVVLAGVPAIMLFAHGGSPRGASPPQARRLKRLVGSSIAAALAVFAGMALMQARNVPAAAGPIVRLTLIGGAAMPVLPVNARTVLQGTQWLDRGVAYDEIAIGRFSSELDRHHNFVPITGADWTPDQPVHFIADLDGNQQPSRQQQNGTGRQGTEPGVLIPGAVPGWLRDAFAERDVTLASDVRIHTTDLAAERAGWFAVALTMGALAALCAWAAVTAG